MNESTYQMPPQQQPSYPPYPQQQPCPPPRPPKGGKGAKIAAIVLAVLVVLLLAGAAYLGVTAYRAQESLAALEADAVQLQSQLDSALKENQTLRSQAEDARSAAAALQEELDQMSQALSEAEAAGDAITDDLLLVQAKANLYDELCQAVKSRDFGLGSGQFFVSKSILVASLSGDYRPKLTLNTTWPEGTTVNIETLGSAATLDFLNDSWDVAVDLEMVPYEEGFSIVTFSNERDDTTFSVLLIVIP